jgi:hypothetical protein
LPRAGYALLPINREQFNFLAAGPPHPDLLQMSSLYVWFILLAAVVWFVPLLPSMLRGLYWKATAHPLQELHERALDEGRAPTGAEIAAAISDAHTGKSAWQLRVLKRKADAFARHLEAQARHL